jgi:hypothetical protein
VAAAIGDLLEASNEQGPPVCQKQSQTQESSATKNTEHTALYLPPGNSIISSQVTRWHQPWFSLIIVLAQFYSVENAFCARLHFGSYRKSIKGLAGNCTRSPRFFF